MKKITKPLKGMIGVLIGTSLGGAAMQQVGYYSSSMGAGIASATQSMIGVGVMSTAAKTIPKKWRK
jgi:hypothetical protein